MKKKQLINKINAYERLMRLDKPIGILLLLWPTLWALWIASEGSPYWVVVGIFVVGTVLARSAGCVMNDLADINFDKYVERTKERPLVTGEVKKKEAIILAFSLFLTAFLLILSLDRLVIYMSFVALFLACTYPLTKRFFSMPQAYLGVAFGFGAPMAFAAVWGTLTLNGWLILLANVFWAIAYDTEYAMVDREDDLKIGVKSSAILFGDRDVQAIIASYFAMHAVLLFLGWRLQMHWTYFLGLLISMILVGYQYWLIKDRDRTNCFKAFNHNNWIGIVIFIAILVSLHFKY